MPHDYQDPANKARALQANRLTMLDDAESEALRELERIRSAKAAVEAERAKAAELRAEAAAVAARQGISEERAMRRLRQEDRAAGRSDGPVDTSKMTREQYLAYRQEKHGF